MPLSSGSSLFGEGQGNMNDADTAYQQQMNAANPDTQSIIGGVNSNASGTGQGTVSGADLGSTLINQNVPSISGGLYSNAMNLANAQAQNYSQMGDAAWGVQAPTISNPNAGVTAAQLAGVNQGYNALNASLGATAAGAGPNVGQAQYQGAQDGGIAAAMAAAHARGGGGMGNQLQAAGAGFGGAAGSAAAARGQQIANAQSGLAGSLGAQGGVNLAAYGNQSELNQQQADLIGQQAQQNTTQALNLYGLSQAQQQASAADLNAYDTDAISTLNAGTAHQNTVNNQTLSQIGTYSAAGGMALGLA